ncbi:hypothetical protein SAMN04488003_10896 [Loktanella fryxellensis]|uniref:DUF2125 domain-containing protein n=1 Tax=Loktanella fryxellensis TaxID=245187 RepID=A0A1H8DC86_9RHOB|nr:DUF2125 domain-containing protein [Loktanella fryxellensis]SEN04882.1 hypothetical protein SAMN04488003_10896 [Loktanella fryxellensis]
MKLLTIIVLALAGLYSAYWFIAARTLDGQLQSGLAAAVAQGWQIESESLTTGGYPSRFDVTARDLTVTTPGGDVTWRAPVVETAALSYAPNRVILALPPSQTVAVQGQTVTIGSDGLRASLGVAANTSLALDTLTAEARALDLVSDRGWSWKTGAALLALRPDGTTPGSYDAYLGLANVTPGVALSAAPDGPAQVTVDATVQLDRPLDRTGLAGAPPQVQQLSLTTAEVTWGDLRLVADGAIDVDATGVPTGQILLALTGWQDVLTLIAEAGLLDPGLLSVIRNGASFMAAGQDTLTMPLTFADGAMALGPIPIGPAPRLILR